MHGKGVRAAWYDLCMNSMATVWGSFGLGMGHGLEQACGHALAQLGEGMGSAWAQLCKGRGNAKEGCGHIIGTSLEQRAWHEGGMGIAWDLAC